MESIRELPKLIVLRRMLTGYSEEEAKRDFKVWLHGSVIGYGSAAIFFVDLAVVHLGLHQRIPLWVTLITLVWTYLAAITSVVLINLTQFKKVLVYTKKGAPSFLEKKIEREAAALMLLQGVDQKRIAEFGERIQVELETRKFLIEGFTVVAAGLSGTFAASIAVADKHLAITSFLVAIQPYIGILIVVTLFAILGLTGDRQLYHRLAWVTRKASGRSSLDEY